jgi:hypothetical protein
MVCGDALFQGDTTEHLRLLLVNSSHTGIDEQHTGKDSTFAGNSWVFQQPVKARRTLEAVRAAREFQMQPLS